MNLHSNKQLFRDAVEATSQRINIPEIYIEKDYWVTIALHTIFHSSIGYQAVFKGGTALSKCHKLIERFSEDVDIVVLSSPGESGNQLKNKLKAVTEAVSSVIPEIDVDGITNKMGQIRKTAHKYNRENFKGAFGQVREYIIIEASWLGSYEPFIEAPVSSYISEMMNATGTNDLISKYQLQPFTVKVLSKERTLCEKIMSLVRFSQTEDPYSDLSNKVRHIYDIHKMLETAEIKNFFESNEFDTLLLKVGNDDVLSYKNKNAWLKKHPAEAIIFNQPEATWDRIKTTYRTLFKDIVIGKLPEEEALVVTLVTIEKRLRKVSWKI